MTDYVICGIGNPGPEHEGQRHNVGFWAIDKLAKRHNIKMKSSTMAVMGKGKIGDSEVLLIKPRTFVNSSGKAVGPALKKENVPASNLIVVYDDLDLAPGKLRMRPKGGDGGHNGLKSISAAAGTQEYGRVRVGVGRPYHQGVPTWDPEFVVRYVLQDPPKDQRELIDDALERTADAIEVVFARGWERAMDEANRNEPAPPMVGRAKADGAPSA